MGGREVEKGKGRAPKLLLNQGPSENCYATGTKPSAHPSPTAAKKRRRSDMK